MLRLFVSPDEAVDAEDPVGLLEDILHHLIGVWDARNSIRDRQEPTTFAGLPDAAPAGPGGSESDKSQHSDKSGPGNNLLKTSGADSTSKENPQLGPDDGPRPQRTTIMASSSAPPHHGAFPAESEGQEQFRYSDPLPVRPDGKRPPELLDFSLPRRLLRMAFKPEKVVDGYHDNGEPSLRGHPVWREPVLRDPNPEQLQEQQERFFHFLDDSFPACERLTLREFLHRFGDSETLEAMRADLHARGCSGLMLNRIREAHILWALEPETIGRSWKEYLGRWHHRQLINYLHLYYILPFFADRWKVEQEGRTLLWLAAAFPERAEGLRALPVEVIRMVAQFL